MSKLLTTVSAIGLLAMIALPARPAPASSIGTSMKTSNRSRSARRGVTIGPTGTTAIGRTTGTGITATTAARRITPTAMTRTIGRTIGPGFSVGVGPFGFGFGF